MTMTYSSISYVIGSICDGPIHLVYAQSCQWTCAELNMFKLNMLQSAYVVFLKQYSAGVYFFVFYQYHIQIMAV